MGSENRPASEWSQADGLGLRSQLDRFGQVVQKHSDPSPIDKQR